VVPKARPMPLQSFAQRTVSPLPCGIRRPLVKLARPARRRFRGHDRSRSALPSTPSASRVVGLCRDASDASGFESNSKPGLFFRDTNRFARSFRFRLGPKVLPSASGLLSWGSSKIAPPPVQVPCVHSRVGRGPPFGPKQPHSERVPPLPFFPTSTVCSARHPAGLLHPASGHGVRHVSGPPLPVARRLRAGARLPRWRSTLRSFPLRSRSAGVTARRFPLAVVPGFRPRPRPCRHVRTLVLLPFARPQGFVPPRSPLRPAGVAAAKLPDAPLGLVPRLVRRYLFPPPHTRIGDGRSRPGPKTAPGPPVGDPALVRRPRRGRPWETGASSSRPRAGRVRVRWFT
jgi:hypothetical protein